MAVYIRPGWRKYIPHFEFYINIPLIRIQMMVFRESYDLYGFIYLGFQWKIWKWEGNVKLFDVGHSINQVYLEEDDFKKIGSCGCFVSQKYKIKHFCDKHLKEL